MLDYKGIEALYTVQELQSFEAAAKKLHITQSAVSQRIKSLETYYTQPLLIRSLPYRPTKLGAELIGHFKRICLLEEDFKEQLELSKSSLCFSIAMNRDSLETWFLQLIEQTQLFDGVTLEIIADDQERTLNYLKNGLASAAISTSDQEIVGGKVQFLGSMEYILVASPAFIKKYFPKGINVTSLYAPALKFDQNDKLHERYLERFFGLKSDELNYHIIPSVQGFKQCTLRGYGYGLIPKIDIQDELKNKKLIQLHPQVWDIPLYWHYWSIQSKRYEQLNIEFVRCASHLLKK